MPLNLFDTASILIVLAALFALLNHHTLKLPFAIAMMIAGLASSLGVLLLDYLAPGLGIQPSVEAMLLSIDFDEALLHGMLSFLLFACSLNINLEDLLAKKGPILSLATFGVLFSTLAIGAGSFFLFRSVGTSVPLPYCFVFGALISPTDPIAVLSIMGKAGAPKSLKIKIAGESLFNDGVGVVLFTVLLAIATGSGDHSLLGIVLRVGAMEILGGLLLGFGAGLLVYRAMHTLKEPNLEILLSVALVMGITFVAFQIHASAPIACVIAGLFIGNHGRRFAMSEETRQSLDRVWSFFDEALNAVLFLLVGLEVVAVRFRGEALLAAAVLLPFVIAVRYASVWLPFRILRFLQHQFTRGAVQILTWGGLRGGISVALALSLPAFEGRETVLAATYGIVLFSILVQGLTVGRLIEKVVKIEKNT